jgi:hypothetical protein
VNILEFSSPAQQLRRCLEEHRSEFFSFNFKQYYLPGSPSISLFAVIAWAEVDAPVVLVTEKIHQAQHWLVERGVTTPLEREDIDLLASHLGTAVVPLTRFWTLQPVAIAKPWGQEIWYTGIEQRGQSAVTDGRYSVPLPWLMALGADRLLCSGAMTPNLLKVLDPCHEEVFGDLYFELHQQKQEVYVITAISPQAWPGGEGAILYGFSPSKRQIYGDDTRFRNAYLAVVKKYESIRRRIDAVFDECRTSSGLGLNDPVAAEQLQRWLLKVPKSLVAEEVAARQAMNDFAHVVPLKVGDVVKVDCLIPHGLQHGVRAVEFQTPVYEGKILSFAQKVLTQNHWDTDEAVQLMRLDHGAVENLAVVEKTPAFCLEQVVAFDDFFVYRLTLKPKGKYRFPCRGSYFLLMIIAGQICVDSDVLRPENAFLFPATSSPVECINSGTFDAVLLISAPFAL